MERTEAYKIYTRERESFKAEQSLELHQDMCKGSDAVTEQVYTLLEEQIETLSSLDETISNIDWSRVLVHVKANKDTLLAKITSLGKEQQRLYTELTDARWGIRGPEDESAKQAFGEAYLEHGIEALKKHCLEYLTLDLTLFEKKKEKIEGVPETHEESTDMPEHAALPETHQESALEARSNKLLEVLAAMGYKLSDIVQSLKERIRDLRDETVQSVIDNMASFTPPSLESNIKFSLLSKLFPRTALEAFWNKIHRTESNQIPGAGGGAGGRGVTLGYLKRRESGERLARLESGWDHHDIPFLCFDVRTGFEEDGDTFLQQTHERYPVKRVSERAIGFEDRTTTSLTLKSYIEHDGSTKKGEDMWKRIPVPISKFAQYIPVSAAVGSSRNVLFDIYVDENGNYDIDAEHPYTLTIDKRKTKSGLVVNKEVRTPMAPKYATGDVYLTYVEIPHDRNDVSIFRVDEFLADQMQRKMRHSAPDNPPLPKPAPSIETLASKEDIEEIRNVNTPTVRKVSVLKEILHERLSYGSSRKAMSRIRRQRGATPMEKMINAREGNCYDINKLGFTILRDVDVRVRFLIGFDVRNEERQMIGSAREYDAGTVKPGEMGIYEQGDPDKVHPLSSIADGEAINDQKNNRRIRLGFQPAISRDTVDSAKRHAALQYYDEDLKKWMYTDFTPVKTRRAVQSDEKKRREEQRALERVKATQGAGVRKIEQFLRDGQSLGERIQLLRDSVSAFHDERRALYNGDDKIFLTTSSTKKNGGDFMQSLYTEKTPEEIIASRTSRRAIPSDKEARMIAARIKAEEFFRGHIHTMTREHDTRVDAIVSDVLDGVELPEKITRGSIAASIDKAIRLRSGIPKISTAIRFNPKKKDFNFTAPEKTHLDKTKYNGLERKRGDTRQYPFLQNLITTMKDELKLHAPFVQSRVRGRMQDAIDASFSDGDTFNQTTLDLNVQKLVDGEQIDIPSKEIVEEDDVLADDLTYENYMTVRDFVHGERAAVGGRDSEGAYIDIEGKTGTPAVRLRVEKPSSIKKRDSDEEKKGVWYRG